MRIYTVHRPAAGVRGEVVLIKEGLCWPAALFGALWALWHRLWWPALALTAAALALELAVELVGLGPLGGAAVSLGYAAIVGYLANDWRRAALARRLYRFDRVIAAGDADTALRRYVDLYGYAPASAGERPQLRQEPATPAGERPQLRQEPAPPAGERPHIRQEPATPAGAAV